MHAEDPAGRGVDDQFRLLVETVLDYAIFMLDPTGTIVTWNSGAERIKGYSAAEIVGSHFSRFYSAEDRLEGKPAQLLTVAAALGRSEDEGWRIRKDGSRFWANVIITAIRAEDTGELTGFGKVTRDLTERKRIEDQLRAGRDELEYRVGERTAELAATSEDLQRTVDALQLRDRAMQAVSQGILITDPHQPDNPILYASPGLERLTGYAAAEMMGRNCRFLQGEETDPQSVATLRRAIAERRECSVELLNYRKDGSSFWNAVSVTPVRDEGGRLTHFVGVQVDVTERRNLEAQIRQTQKMEAFGQLAGGIAHDFNNLLTIIAGYSEVLLVELPEDDARRSCVLEITRAGERASALTRQLLSFSRRMVVEPQLLDLNEIVHETERMLRRLIGEDIVFTAVLDPSISRTKVDAGQMGQVLMNLAVNARDAMPQGGRLTIETKDVVLDEPFSNVHLDVRPGRYVLLTVTDTGAGMAPEVEGRIFEPFFTTKGAGAGTGMGLSVVHGIVKQSHGHIGVYSEPGVGTAFKVYLPAADELPAATGEDAGPTAIGRGSESVLFVEDEEGVREIAVLALRAYGYSVLSAGSGAEALRLLADVEDPIHILVTDVVMPALSGRQLAELLRPRFPHMKVLYMSGYTDDAVVRHGILHAEVAFLQKPYTPTTLLRKIRLVLDQS